MRTPRIALCCVILLTLLLGAVIVDASGGGSYRVWFVDPHGPRTGTLEEWLEEPPILEASFSRPWLIAAWRDAMGRPLSEVEKRVVAHLVGVPRSSAWAREEGTTVGSNVGSHATESPESRWRAVRRELSLKRSWAATYRTLEQEQADGTTRYVFFENCLPGAFGAAADTFADRQGRSDYDEEALRGWVAAQDRVFANCPNIEEASLPEPVPADAPRLVREDRQYQIGAAQFYAGAYEEAIATWDALAEQGGELTELARYLTGRAALRWHDVGALSGEERARAAAEAQRRLSEFVATGSSPQLVASAEGLLDLLELRTDPQARLRRAALAVATGDYTQLDAASVDAVLVRRAWSDLGYLLKGDLPQRVECVDPATQAEANLSWNDAGEELAVWLSCLNSPSRAALASRVAQANGASRTLWATAALLGVSRGGEVHDDAALRTLQQMAEQAPELFGGDGDLPPWLRLTVAVHAARIENARRLHPEARDRLAAFDADGLRLDDRNRFLKEWSRAASSFDGWLESAVLAPVAEGWSDASELIWDMGERRYPRVVRSEVVQIARGAFGSAAVLAMARHPATPDWMRPSLLVRAWLLATLDGDEHVSADVARELVALEPQSLPNGYDADEFRMATLPRAAVADLQRWLELPFHERPWWTAWMLLQHKELGIFPPDVEQGLWPQPWCRAFHLEPDLAPLRNLAGLPRLPEFEGYAPYASAEEVMRWAADQVFARLQEALRSGDASSDKQLAEALHLLVRRTKPAACRDGEVSQRAFQALHEHYRGSEWARATPYWYE